MPFDFSSLNIGAGDFDHPAKWNQLLLDLADALNNYVGMIDASALAQAVVDAEADKVQTGLDRIQTGIDAALFDTKLDKAGGTLTGDVTITNASTPTITLIDTTNTLGVELVAGNNNGVVRTNSNHPLQLQTNNITFLTGDTSQNATFSGDLTTNGDLTISNTNDSPKLNFKDSAGAVRANIHIGDSVAGEDEDSLYIDTLAETLYLSDGLNVSGNITGAGDLIVTGALSKGSGSFRIDHPLPELNKTHQLVHSFIEGPNADLIYRGQVNLVAGKAEINLDEAARMVEGTFDLLCTNLTCYTNNESGFTPVKSSVTGNTLAIEAEDLRNTDTISWLVIGERKDEHMLDTDWTDENGRVIVEPPRKTIEVPIKELVQDTIFVPSLKDEIVPAKIRPVRDSKGKITGVEEEIEAEKIIKVPVTEKATRTVEGREETQLIDGKYTRVKILSTTEEYDNPVGTNELWWNEDGSPVLVEVDTGRTETKIEYKGKLYSKIELSAL